MDPKKILEDLNKIPVVGDLIIAFAIIVVFTSLSAASGYFGFEGEDKKLLINIFIYAGIIYFVAALAIKTYTFIKRSTKQNKSK